jgi:hypothetical protein
VNHDVYLIRVESEVEQLSISLTPVNPPIIIPVGGGSFQFTAVIDNLGPGPVVFDKWCNVSVPGMPNPMKIQLSEQNYLSTSGNIIHTLTQFVPGSAPAETYTYLGFVGEYPNFIVDCDSFTFEKSATGSGFNQSPGWMVEGWDGSKDSSFSLSPLAFSLLSIFPNPFNAETSIKFELSNSNLISLAIYNIEGKEVEKLAEGWQEAGSYEIKFDASNLPSGLYFARLKAENFEQTQKLLLIK